MAQAILEATESVFIDGNAATTNFNTAPQVDIGQYGGAEKRRSLIQWDLSTIPVDATITGATLRLHNSGGDLTDNNRTFDIYRVRRNWSETQCTWNVYTTGNSWSTAGCGDTTNDREGTSIGSIACVNPPSAGFQTTTITTSAVQGWIDGSFTNNGIICIMQTETNDMQRFDGVGDTYPPQLTIDYTLPDSGGFYYMSV